MSSLLDVVVGELALRQGLVDGAALQECLAEVARTHSPLGQVLVRRRLVHPAGLLELIQTAERSRLACRSCGQRYLCGVLDPQQEPVCPGCRGPIQVLPERNPAAETGRPRLHQTLALTKPDSQSDTARRSPHGSANLVRPRGAGHTDRHRTGDRSTTRSGKRGGLDLEETFGPYTLLEELGRGGMGVVYKARQPGLDRFVALKVLLGGDMASATQVKRFQREAEIAARLKHPAIVQIHDVGKVGEHHYLTMDFVEGTPLSKLIKKKNLSIGRAATIARDLGRGLAHAHERGVIHRDVKPANIMIEREGSPVLTDFGLARDLEPDAMTQLTRDGAMVGTPYYMSPEQASGKRERVCDKSDVYSLGVVLYELLCDELPHNADTQLELTSKILSEDPPRPRELRPDLDADLETIVLKALEKSPARRYGAGDLADDLDRYLSGQPIQARPQSALERLARRLLRNRRLAGVVLGVALVLSGVAVAGTRHVLRLHAERAAREARAREEAALEAERQKKEAVLAAARTKREAAETAVREARRALDRAQRTPAGDEYRFALQEGIRRLTDAIAHGANTRDPALRILRGRAQERLRKLELAQADLTQAIGLAPQAATALEAAYLLARIHSRAEETPRALRVLESALAQREEPSDRKARAWWELLHALQALLKDRDLASALAAAGRARQHNPLQAEAHAQEGALFVVAAKAEPARNALLKAVELDPKDAVAWANLARVHLSLDPARGESDLKRALELDPELTLALELRASKYQLERRYSEAIGDLRKVLGRRPRDADLLYSLYRLYRLNKQLPQARASLERMQRVAPEDARPFRARAWDLLHDGDFEGALAELLRGVRAVGAARPGGRTHRYLVDLFERIAIETASFATAARYARERLKQDPGDVGATLYLAQVDYGRHVIAGTVGKPQVARLIATLQQILRKVPNHLKTWEAWLQSGLLRLEWSPKKLRAELGRFAKAIDPQKPAELVQLARFQALLLRDLDRAEEIARRALRLDPKSPDALMILGHVLLKQDRVVAGRQALLEAARLDPNNEEALQILGASHFNRRELKRAELYLGLAHGLNPLRESPLEGLGLVLLRTKRPRQALFLSERYVGLCLKAKRPPGPTIVANVVQAHITLRQRVEGLKLLARLERAFPRPDYQLVLASIYLSARQPTKARALITAALRKRPDLKKDAQKLLDELDRQP